MSTAAEDAESVDQFLARIASLKDRRDREDQERIRKVEEEIIQGRKERQARRAERARSISPTKSSPAPSSSATIEPTTMTNRPVDPPVEFSPFSQVQTLTQSPQMQSTQSFRSSKDLSDTPASKMVLPPVQKSSSTPIPTPPTATSLARSGTLSWQQRPSSRDSTSISRHALSASPAPSGLVDVPNIEQEEELSRSQIAESLGSKDPTFFQQTADRSITFAARRRNNSEREPDKALSRSVKLAGLSRDQSLEPEKGLGLEGAFTGSQLPVHNTRSEDSRTLEGSSSTVQLNASALLRSSPLSTPRLVPTESVSTNFQLSDQSPAGFPGWTSARRPPSPTKGLGGFVESAMMKRSDSVSKRWSVQAAPGLQRGDSIAGNRNTLVDAGIGPSCSPGSPPRQARSIRPFSSSSPQGSRPNSSYETSKCATPPSSSVVPSPNNHSITISTLKYPTSQQTKDINSDLKVVSVERERDYARPLSPTKTTDSRRWSPTKSTWLESALARPESPKPLPSKPEEPAWKSGTHKAKSSIDSPSSASPELSRTSPLRSPPAGRQSRPMSIPGMTETSASNMVEKSPEKNNAITRTEVPTQKTAHLRPMREVGDRVDAHVGSMPKTELVENPQVKSLSKSDLSMASSPSTAKSDTPPTKAKPITPPKTDFRSALKSRQLASSEDKNDEPEFKAVFGKLKRTETKNYVAPDELKDNITRGKAGLNFTNGPQKNIRVDEFKESILQKKQAMKEGTGLTTKPSVRQRPAPIVPEALAKKEAIRTGMGLPVKPSPSGKPVPVESEAIAKQRLLGKSAAAASEFKTASVKPKAPPAATVEVEQEANSTFKKLEPAAQNEIGSSSFTSERAAVARPQQTAFPQKQELGNSKLASRLNPALAGFISRGTSPKISNNLSPVTSNEDAAPTPNSLVHKATNASEKAGGTTLSHMTKARAKGPKRRTPKTEEPAASTSIVATLEERERSVAEKVEDTDAGSRPSAETAEVSSVEASSSSRPISIIPPETRETPVSIRPSMPSADRPKARSTSAQHQLETPKVVTELKNITKDKPTVVAKPPDLRKVLSPTPQSAAIEDKSRVTTKSPEMNKVPLPNSDRSLIEAPPSPVRERMRAFDISQDYTQVNVQKPASSGKGWNKISTTSPQTSPLAPATTKLNTPRLPSTPKAEQQKPSITESANTVNGVGLHLAVSSKQEVLPSRTELTPPPEKPHGLSAEKAVLNNGSIEKILAGSPVADSSAKVQLAELFNQTPRAREKAAFDTQAIMSANPKYSQKVTTLNKSIWEITGNGKKESMPAHQEHILFEDSMYLCVHAFQPENGSRSTEAHLWVGDAVPEAAVEDAQLFCRKVARDNSAKLDLLKQGKETANFFQALGGIVITRRNKHSALYVLCGRRHLGHVAFDEVDLEASSLCSGFPYIVSAKFGKLFLWKGRGSGADEVGCARLIGMDLGLTGEIEEINEGEEPPAFWESFASRTRYPWSDLWDLKSTQDAYSCRLYRVEMEHVKSATTGFWGRRGSSPSKSSSSSTNKALVEEISPFCQGDLSPQHVYLLDAYFEIYVYVGDQASLRHVEFVTALMLAQEMSMLAPTLQDRPLMPVCELVFGDPPRDFKAVFRKWEDERHERRSVVVPLDEAIDALE